MTLDNKHCFVLPAYGRSPYLRDCLESLRNQTLRSPIIITSSTPFDGLNELAREFGAEVLTHSPNAGIGRDWNFAVSKARTPWVTIAHQDDIYLPHFTAKTMQAAQEHPGATLVCTAYSDIVDGSVRPTTSQSFMKRTLSEIGFLGRAAVKTPSAKHRLLRFGCPISCPTVSLRITDGAIQFREDLDTNLDWEAWLRLADRPGAFVYIRERLLLCRIHSMSGSSNGIRSGARAQEDLMMFQLFWPEPIARLIVGAYSLSYRHHRPHHPASDSGNSA